MAHLIFIGLHISAALFIHVGALIITIPLHLIYSAVARPRSTDIPSRRTHYRCPACTQFVRKGTHQCTHCGIQIG